MPLLISLELLQDPNSMVYEASTVDAAFETNATNFYQVYLHERVLIYRCKFASLYPQEELRRHNELHFV